MRIRILQSRHYVKVGSKRAGDQITVDAAYGAQLCAQGFAEEVKPKPKVEARDSKVKEDSDG